LCQLRRALVRFGREQLHGIVEVDETYWGDEEEAVRGRLTCDKALFAVAAEMDGRGIGRIRLRHIPNVSRKTLPGFIAESIQPGRTVQTGGLNACGQWQGSIHDQQVHRRQPEQADHLLPQAQRDISLLKCRQMGTHPGPLPSTICRTTSTSSHSASIAAPRPHAESSLCAWLSKSCGSPHRTSIRSPSQPKVVGGVT
jgi:hypothetical protein